VHKEEEIVSNLRQEPALHDQSNAFTEPLALQILNTVRLVDGVLLDSLQTDNDVLQWLAQAGWPIEKVPSSLRPSTLLNATRKLRETIRTLVERRKAGKRLDVSALNEFLSESRSYVELVAEKSDGIHLIRRWKRRTPEEVLAPLAESAADFLVTADFDLVRRCESEDCVLWFYDRTKSHRRRWCSMTTCGNRHKVAAFRKRQASLTE
jgi:predicted RNA-binding Zn ribbon-like protein